MVSDMAESCPSSSVEIVERKLVLSRPGVPATWRKYGRQLWLPRFIRVSYSRLIVSFSPGSTFMGIMNTLNSPSGENSGVMSPEGLSYPFSLASLGTKILKTVRFSPAPSFHKTSLLIRFLMLSYKKFVRSRSFISFGFKE